MKSYPFNLINQEVIIIGKNDRILKQQQENKELLKRYKEIDKFRTRNQYRR